MLRGSEASTSPFGGSRSGIRFSASPETLLSDPYPSIRSATVRSQQLSLSLDRWPIPGSDGTYERSAAHRQAFEHRCAGGRICIELWVLEVVPDLYIQAIDVQLGEVVRSTPLRVTPRNRYDTPEAALRAAARKAARELKSNRRTSGLYPENQSAFLRATNWLEDVLDQCDYLLERQVNLFG